MRPEEFLSGLREVLNTSLAGPMYKSSGNITLEDLAYRVEDIAKSVNDAGTNSEAFQQIAKSFETIAEHIGTHSAVLERVMDRLEQLEGATVMRKSAAGQDATTSIQKSRGGGNQGTFGTVFQALAAGQAVELR